MCVRVVVVAQLVTCRATFWTHGKSCRQALSLSTAAAASVALGEWFRKHTHVQAHSHTHTVKHTLCIPKKPFQFPQLPLLLLYLLQQLSTLAKLPFLRVNILYFPPSSWLCHCATLPHSHYHCLQAQTQHLWLTPFRIWQPANCQCAGSGNALLDLAAKCSFRRQVATAAAAAAVWQATTMCYTVWHGFSATMFT